MRHTLFLIVCHLTGALTSIHAILEVRTSQGAIAWVISLNTFPYVAVPAYWVFGELVRPVGDPSVNVSPGTTTRRRDGAPGSGERFGRATSVRKARPFG